jgi:uncharacterized protein HemX
MMTLRTPMYHRPEVRQAEGEGILRMLLLAVAVAMPLATMAYLKIQNTRLSYEMTRIRTQIQEEEELQRVLLMERSRLRRDEEIQSFAVQVGMLPRKQSLLVHRAFSPKDQKLAKLGPVSSLEQFPR